MNKTKLDEELPILTVDEAEKQSDVKTEYFHEYRPCKEKPGELMVNNSKKLETPKIWVIHGAESNDHTYIQVLRTLKRPKRMYSFDMERTQFRVQPMDATS